MDTLESPWRKASYSGGNGGACIEVGKHDGTVLVRDSKLACGPELPFTSAAWTDFLATLK